MYMYVYMYVYIYYTKLHTPRPKHMNAHYVYVTSSLCSPI